MCDQIEELMGKGMTIAQAAVEMGVTRKTIYQWGREHEDFAEALERARDKSRAFYDERMMELACSPAKESNPAVFIFAMKGMFPELRSLDSKVVVEGGNPEKPLVTAEVSKTEWLEIVKQKKQQDDCDNEQDVAD